MVGKETNLVFGSLKEGIHEFSYVLTTDFFTSIEQDLIVEGDVNVLLYLERFERHMSLDFKLEGWVNKPCDVCLSELQYPIKSSQHLQVKITDKEMEDEAEMVSIGSNEYEIDLGGHLFDFVALSVPMKIECMDSLNRKECDENVLERLATDDVDNENTTHPEWQKLKEIFKN